MKILSPPRSRLSSLAAGSAAAVLLVALGWSPAAADLLAPTVVGSWHLEEPEGNTTALDSSGFNNNGTISPDVLQGVPGVVGSGFEFTGSNPIVRVPNGTGSLNPGGSPLTLSAWLKVPADLVPGDYNVVQKGTATAAGGAYKLEVFAPTNTANKKWGFPDCAVNSSATATAAKHKDRAYGPTRINDGNWHQVECHLTATDLYVTVDGVSGTPVTRTTGPIANTADLTIGGKPNNTHYFRGVLDEITITIG